MTPKISAGLGSAGLADRIAARYQVQADNASTLANGGARPAAPVTRVPPPGAKPPEEQTRGGMLDLSA